MQIFEFSGGVHRHFIAALFCAAAVFALSANLKSRHRALAQFEAATFAEDMRVSDAKPRANMKALEAAARKGDIAASLEVARRYGAGLGVGKSDGQAFFFYRLITERYSQINPADARSAQVAAAMRASAQLYRKGIVDARIAANPAAAVDLLRYAGSYFGDAAAQYDLATLILNGEGVARNPRAAVQWLLNASRKGYAPAQALLGSLLWQGEGVERAPGDGLGLLAVARHNIAPADRPWVDRLFDKAASEATATELLEANAFIAQEASAQGWSLTDELLVRKPPPAPSDKATADENKVRNGAATPFSVNFLRNRAKARLAAGDSLNGRRDSKTAFQTPGIAVPQGYADPSAGFAGTAIQLASGQQGIDLSPAGNGLTPQ